MISLIQLLFTGSQTCLKQLSSSSRSSVKHWDENGELGTTFAFKPLSHLKLASLVAQTVKRLPAMPETRVQFLVREDLLEKEMAIHSITPAWKIPWREEPDRPQSMGSQRLDTTERLHRLLPSRRVQNCRCNAYNVIF